MTFRSGGMGLSGQLGSHCLLVVTCQHFRDVEVPDCGKRFRCGPGMRLTAGNAPPDPTIRRPGPDPVSVMVCTRRLSACPQLYEPAGIDRRRTSRVRDSERSFQDRSVSLAELSDAVGEEVVRRTGRCC